MIRHVRRNRETENATPHNIFILKYNKNNVKSDICAALTRGPDSIATRNLAKLDVRLPPLWRLRLSTATTWVGPRRHWVDPTVWRPAPVHRWSTSRQGRLLWKPNDYNSAHCLWAKKRINAYLTYTLYRCLLYKYIYKKKTNIFNLI